MSATPHTGLGCLGEPEKGCRAPHRQRQAMLWDAVGTARIDSQDRAHLPGSGLPGSGHVGRPWAWAAGLPEPVPPTELGRSEAALIPSSSLHWRAEGCRE